MLHFSVLLAGAKPGGRPLVNGRCSQIVLRRDRQRAPIVAAAASGTMSSRSGRSAPHGCVTG
jgi:hypothetical protein